MPTRRASTACLVVICFVALSTLADRGVTHKVIYGNGG